MPLLKIPFFFTCYAGSIAVMWWMWLFNKAAGFTHPITELAYTHQRFPFSLQCAKRSVHATVCQGFCHCSCDTVVILPFWFTRSVCVCSSEALLLLCPYTDR